MRLQIGHYFLLCNSSKTAATAGEFPGGKGRKGPYCVDCGTQKSTFFEQTLLLILYFGLEF